VDIIYPRVYGVEAGRVVLPGFAAIGGFQQFGVAVVVQPAHPGGGRVEGGHVRHEGIDAHRHGVHAPSDATVFGERDIGFGWEEVVVQAVVHIIAQPDGPDDVFADDLYIGDANGVAEGRGVRFPGCPNLSGEGGCAEQRDEGSVS